VTLGVTPARLWDREAGGLGEVWKARDSRLNRVVALKFILVGHGGPALAVDLRREARAAFGSKPRALASTWVPIWSRSVCAAISTAPAAYSFTDAAAPLIASPRRLPAS
jgi:hypothetical protein